MHVRFPFAAVDAAVLVPSPLDAPHVARAPAPVVVTLWAERPLPVRGGRVVAVRTVDGVLRAGVAGPSSPAVRWVDPASVLTEAQAARWIAGTRFGPGRR